MRVRPSRSLAACLALLWACGPRQQVGDTALAGDGGGLPEDDTGSGPAATLCPSAPPAAEGLDVELLEAGDAPDKVSGLYALGEASCDGEDCAVDLFGYLKVQRADVSPRIVRVDALDLLRWSVDEGSGVGLGEVGTFDDGSLGTPSLRAEDGGWTMWYRADDHEQTQVVARARSTDGWTWTVDDQPALEPVEAWADKAVIAPHVVEVGDELWMYYRGSRYGNQSESDIGLATSSDGLTWVPHPDNPVFRRSEDGWDRSLLADPHVWWWGGRFLMLYSGHARGTTPEMSVDEVGLGKQIGVAASRDGVVWERCFDGPVIVDGTKSDNAFVLDTGDGVAVYYRQTQDGAGGGGSLRVVRWVGWPTD